VAHAHVRVCVRARVRPGASCVFSLAAAPIDLSLSFPPSSQLLSFWLREDVSDRALVTGGIGAGELATILDRPRALQAGQRVADIVEARLQRELMMEAGCTEDGEGEMPGEAAGEAAGETAGAAAPRAPVAAPAAPIVSSAQAPRPGGKKGGAGAGLASHFDWRAWADAAPHTPSKGAAYEFVYNASSKGLLSGMLGGAGGAAAAPEEGAAPEAAAGGGK